MELLDKIILLSKKLGYASNPDGICFGLSHMAMQAAQLRDLVTYNNRLDFIDSLSEQDIEDIQHLDINKNMPGKLFDLQVFCEDVELYQQGHSHFQFIFDPQLYQAKQQAIQVIPLVLPDALEAKGGLIKTNEYSGIYIVEELQSVLNEFQQSFKNLNGPVSLILNSLGHTINVNFDPQDNKWTIIDSKNLPPKVYDVSELKKLSKAIIKGFYEVTYGPISTQIYTSGDQASEVKALMENSFTKPAWKYLHDPSTQEWQQLNFLSKPTDTEWEQKNRADQIQAWLYISAYDGHFDIAKKLLALGPNPTIKLGGAVTSSFKNSPLEISSLRQNWDLTLLMLMAIKKEDLKNVNPQILKFINNNTKSLVEQCINYTDSLPTQERNMAIKRIINSENALGAIFNKSSRAETFFNFLLGKKPAAVRKISENFEPEKNTTKPKI